MRFLYCGGQWLPTPIHPHILEYRTYRFFMSIGVQLSCIYLLLQY